MQAFSGRCFARRRRRTRGRSRGTRAGHGRPLRPAQPSGRARPSQFDPAKEQYPGVVLGIAMASYRTPQGRGPLPGPARRRREADLPHGRHAAEGRQRQLHDRRFLREQDERVRRQLRLRADPRAAGAARHDRSGDGRAAGQFDPDQAQARRRRRRGPRQAPRRPSRRSCTACHTWRDKQGAAAWRPCRWRRPSSTCSCS